MTKQTDSQEQYSRRSCIPINGIEKAENESTTDCVNKVIDIFKDVEDVHLSAEDMLQRASWSHLPFDSLL